MKIWPLVSLSQCVQIMHVVFVLDKLSGLYLTKSHAVKIHSPVTLEVVPLMMHNHRVESTSVHISDVHYLWLFGDEASWNLILLIVKG